MKKSALLFLLTTLLSAAGAAQDWQERYRQYRESTEDFVASQSEALKAVMEHDQRRSHMIETKLKEHKERLNDHESGRRRLKNVEEYEALQHKIVVFQRALDTLAKEGVNEKMEKLQDADYRDMRRIDYIDFGRTGI